MPPTTFDSTILEVGAGDTSGCIGSTSADSWGQLTAGSPDLATFSLDRNGTTLTFVAAVPAIALPFVKGDAVKVELESRRDVTGGGGYDAHGSLVLRTPTGELLFSMSTTRDKPPPEMSWAVGAPTCELSTPCRQETYGNLDVTLGADHVMVPPGVSTAIGGYVVAQRGPSWAEPGTCSDFVPPTAPIAVLRKTD